MRKAIVIGLTGQTGAGKTTVADGLRHFGYQVIKADEIARLVTEKGSPVLQELAAVFGKDILKEDGTLDRALLAERAFATPEETKLLNGVTHPEILRLINKKINGASHFSMAMRASSSTRPSSSSPASTNAAPSSCPSWRRRTCGSNASWSGTASRKRRPACA